jgi:hypothetical protein
MESNKKMSRDFIFALVLIGIFVVLTAINKLNSFFLESLLMLTRPGATILVLGSVAALYHYGYRASALIAGILSIYLLKNVGVNWVRSDKRRLYLEVGRDQARFDPSSSIDLQFANGTVTHNLPHLLVPPSLPDMLVFPPSAETQREMNG